MMIVMKETATDEEVEAVVEKIESAGALAHRIVGARLTVIGAIGDVEQDVNVEGLGLEGQPGVDRVMPILKPYKLASAQITHGERTVLDIGGRKVGGEQLRADRRTVHGRVARADAADRARGARRRRHAAARRRLQAAHLPLRLPGPRPGGPAAARRGQGGDGPADRHRADGHARHRRRAGGRRRDADRRAQHAELPAARRDRPLGAPGAAQAWAVLDARRAADGGRVHPQGRQPQRDAVRARHPHVRDRLPLHARPDGGAGAQGALAPAGDRRPEPRGRAARAGACRCRWPRRPSAPTGSSSRCTPTPTRRSATVRRRCARRTSPTSRRRSSRRRRSRARRSAPSDRPRGLVERNRARGRADRRIDRPGRPAARRRAGLWL